MATLRIAITALLFFVVRFSDADCTGGIAWQSCVTPMYDKKCGTAVQELESCLCENAKTYFHCYTSLCTADSLYSSFYSGIVTDCGTAPGGGAPAATTTAGTTPQGAGPKPTGNSAGFNSLPLGATGRDCIVLAVMAVLWLGGLGAVLL